MTNAYVHVRPVAATDAADLADLLNAIILAGGTTALQQLFSPEHLTDTYLNGPNVLCCLVAVHAASGRIEGFQTLGRLSSLPGNIGDIGTFARVGRTQLGVGSALFASTVARARALGLVALNAVIRADNFGGLAFYTRQGFVDHNILPAVPLQDGTAVDRIIKRYVL